MEDFILNIYNDAFVIEHLKEFISLVNSGHKLAARDIYNTATKELEDLLIRLSSDNPSTAIRIQDIALTVKDIFDDTCNATGIIESQLLPELYSYMNNFTGIDVTAGRYRLLSSDTGFLTIYDSEKKLYLHNTYDPVWESYEIARSIYKYDTDNFLIYGCGLGYLAYQIYMLSYGSTKVIIYEDDEKVLDYAYLYGVLSLIPEDKIQIIHEKNKDSLSERFLADLNNLNATDFFFAPWKKGEYNEKTGKELSRIIINNDLSLETDDLSAINLRMNQKLVTASFEMIKDLFTYREWIIISAGPSLDNNIDFLKESKGKRGLIAVNTVLKRLIKEKIYPDIVVAADRSNDLKKHIQDIVDSTINIPLIADWVLNWQYAGMYKGPICFVRTNASSEITQSAFYDEPVWDISGTVACLGVEAAVNLNADRIFLVGQDLAFPEGRKYAKDMPHAEAPDAKWELQVQSVDGKMVDTCEAFDWFRKALEYQITRYEHIDFINMSAHGALIKGASSPNF